MEDIFVSITQMVVLMGSHSATGHMYGSEYQISL